MPISDMFPFDPSFYRATNDDIAHLDDVSARAHYVAFGIAEGRQGSPLGARPAFTQYIKSSRSVLEIGPFCSPVLTGPNVAYLDVLDAEELRRRAVQLSLDPAGCPSEIRFVGSIAQVHETFDAVVSSHSIEHQVDLIEHFQAVGRILNTGGCYYLIIPDKRFCFDHYLPATHIGGVLQAHEEKRAVHTLRSVIEHLALTTHNDATRHWAGDHGERYSADQLDRVRAARTVFEESQGAYVDVHAWYFTPENFVAIAESLHALGASPLRPTAVYPTTMNTLEFFVVLEKA